MKIQIKKIKPAHEDERGKIFDVIDNEVIEHAGIVTFKKGAVRGKHYHKLSTQYNYILSGQIKLAIKDIKQEDAPVEIIMMEEGDMVLLPTYCYHSLEALEDTILLYFTPKARMGSEGYENDTYRIEI